MDEFPLVRLFGGGRQMSDRRRDGIVVGHHSTATTRGDNFIAVEAERRRLPECAGMAVFNIRAQRFRSIFDKRDPEVGADVFECCHVSGMPERMNADQGFDLTSRGPVDGRAVLALADALKIRG